MNMYARSSAKRSRWMDWKPKVLTIEDAAENEPTKPTKPSFVGFAVDTPRESSILRDLPTHDLAERRFGQPHAKLFPFLGRKVRTPEGPGTLLQVFADRVTVLLNCELSHCSFFSPREVEPISVE